MFTTLFFMLLLVYLLAGGEATEVLKFGCLWLAVCLIGEIILWSMLFGIFGIFFL